MRKVSDEQVIRERNHLEMLRRPHLWPDGYLRLKKGVNPPRMRFAFMVGGPRPLLYELEPMESPQNLRVPVEARLGCQYETPQAVLDDGWAVVYEREI